MVTQKQELTYSWTSNMQGYMKEWKIVTALEFVLEASLMDE